MRLGDGGQIAWTIWAEATEHKEAKLSILGIDGIGCKKDPRGKENRKRTDKTFDIPLTIRLRLMAKHLHYVAAVTSRSQLWVKGAVRALFFLARHLGGCQEGVYGTTGSCEKWR